MKYPKFRPFIDWDHQNCWLNLRKKNDKTNQWEWTKELRCCCLDVNAPSREGCSEEDEGTRLHTEVCLFYFTFVLLFRIFANCSISANGSHLKISLRFGASFYCRRKKVTYFKQQKEFNTFYYFTFLAYFITFCRDFLLDSILPFLSNRQLYPLRFGNRSWKHLIESGVANGHLSVRPVLHKITTTVFSFFYAQQGDRKWIYNNNK
jgi:hypothetical protein